MIIRPEELDLEMIRALPCQMRTGRPRKGEKPYRYKDIVCAFDIETTRLYKNAVRLKEGELRQEAISFMYVWQFQIGIGITVMGRYWSELTELLDRIADSLTPDERLLVFVHNLSYEFSYLRSPDVLGERLNEKSVFCLKPRKICRFLCCNDRIEFRCSYIHSNMSLDQFTKKMRVEHQKLSGELDYKKVRFPWTPLDPVTEIPYCVNDVLGLVECIYRELEVDHDTLFTIPLTSTGYVRRKIKEALMPRNDYIRRLLPYRETYDLLREAIRGGNTHASRFYAGKRLPGPIRSVDRSSSYPDVQINGRFPTSEFRRPPAEEAHSVRAMMDKIRHDKAVLCRIRFTNIRLRDPWIGCPYIPIDKCQIAEGAALDNGRILSAALLEITLTDIDLKIITADYTWDGECELMEWQYARYGNLPEELKDVIREYYTRKTELKGVEGMEVLYEKAKNLLNGIFGCSCQDPIRLAISYQAGEYKLGAMIDKEFVEGDLEEFKDFLLDSSNPVMPYQWGVWTTANARLQLQFLIWDCGPNFIYCDTDSVYFWGSISFERYNNERRDASIKNRAFATDPAGITHYMGTVEEDLKNGPYLEYKTLGAKKYAYRDKKGVLHITISGVVKEEGAIELEEAGGLDAMDPGDEFHSGFTFRKAGGIDILYQDSPIGTILAEGRELYVGTGAVLMESTYTLSLSDNYQALLTEFERNDLWSLISDVNSGKRIDISQ